MEVILLERINRLGGIGDVVRVRDGFARNFLIPTQKALRANKENREVFESQREGLEKLNAERRAVAQEQAKTYEGLVVTVVRQASEDGKLYGSVSVRDVAEAMDAQDKKIDRRLIDLNAAIKTLGVYNVTLNLHPEVQVTLKVHVARNVDSPLPDELKDEPEAAPVELASETASEAEAPASNEEDSDAA